MGWVDNATPEVDAQSQYPLIIAICVSLSVVSITVVCTRLWIRHSNHGLQADDHMATLSMVFALIYSVLCIVQTKYGLGLPLALRPKENLIAYTRSNYAGRPIYQMGISFFKVALLISYLRLFQGTSHRGYRRAVWITIAAVLLGHLGCSLCLVLACTPVHKSWDPLVAGTCLAPGPSFTGYAMVTIVSDLAVTIIPLPVLIKLKIGRGKKVGLIFIFVLGLFTTLCSILRYLQIDRIQYGDGNSTMLILWGVIEFNVGNMVSSLPFLAPVFLRKAKEYRSRYPYGGHGSSGKSGSGRARGAGSHKIPSHSGGSKGGMSGLYKGDDAADSYQLDSVSQTAKNGGGIGIGFAVTSSSPQTTTQNASQEEILKESRPDGGAAGLNRNRSTTGPSGIIKSISYTVRVEDEKHGGVAGGR